MAYFIVLPTNLLFRGYFFHRRLYNIFIKQKFRKAQFGNRELSLINKQEVNNLQHIPQSKALEDICYFGYGFVHKLIVEIEKYNYCVLSYQLLEGSLLCLMCQMIPSIHMYNMVCYQLACRAAADHCRNKGKHITKLAMKYSLMNDEISTVLVGMNSPEQVYNLAQSLLDLWLLCSVFFKHNFKHVYVKYPISMCELA